MNGRVTDLQVRPVSPDKEGRSHLYKIRAKKWPAQNSNPTKHLPRGKRMKGAGEKHLP